MSDILQDLLDGVDLSSNITDNLELPNLFSDDLIIKVLLILFGFVTLLIVFCLLCNLLFFKYNPL